MKTATKCGHIRKWKHLGTVSHGTMKAVDLINAFYPVLEELDPTLANDMHRRYDASLETLGTDDETDDCRECADDCLSELFDGIGACCPTGIYFGANEGDGSDYGFWFMEPDDVRKVDELPETPEKDESEIILVSDHGNVALYAWCDPHGWQEVYGVV